MNHGRNAVVVVVATVAAGLVTLGFAPMVAAADTTVVTLGGEGTLVNGDIVEQWTVGDLKPSADVIPYPVQGALFEATATDVAVHGSATPIISNFSARTNSGDSYRVLFDVATPQGVSPATLDQGQQTTGKLYFDITGDIPSSVVYNAGGDDLIVWTPAPPRPAPPAPPGSRRTPDY
jgi:hypothetical protein